MAKKFKKKTIAIIGAIAGALLGYGAIGAIVNQPALYGVPQEYLREEFEVFNSKFESYEGTNIKGSQVKNFINTIIAHNSAYIDDIDKIVTFNGTSNIEELKNIKVTISASKIYNISLEYNEGYVKNIICEEVK